MQIEWINARDELPESGSVVLGWSLTADELVIVGYDEETGQWTLEDDYATSIEVSHWMPLIPKPEVKNGKMC